MTEIFENIGKINYEGKDSKNPLSFKFYDSNKLVAGKTMKEQLKFAMAWWHNLCATGQDMFGPGTADKSFGTKVGTMEHAHKKVEAGFEFMDKLGVDYFCFHDVDLVPEAEDIKETNKRLDEISDHIKELQEKTNKKLLWGTANCFSHPKYMAGAGSSSEPEVFAFAAAQIKKALDLTVKLEGEGYTFWGGREGYDSLLNTNIGLEKANIGRLMRIAVEYGRSIGFTGIFYIEPKPKEPTKHQYDFDAETAISFIKEQDLEKDFKLNIEANHATLATHTFQHDLRIARINDMLGSVDANQGDYLLGWDTDEFPADVYETTFAMYEILKAGGLTTGGLNFDAKNRRQSYTYEDMFKGFILGMDSFALGLINADKIINDGRIDQFIEKKYSGFKEGLGKKIIDGDIGLKELSDLAESRGKPALPPSGNQEGLQSIINQIIFS
ncbi:MAG: xylose isomerase [Clostridiales Family XIII bacterium]|jgi:xylose isomerase|nr:xylose isomerase [Clostridiales Family XIII bacterium]